jgi:broad specificity phosphatase PhoE
MSTILIIRHAEKPEGAIQGVTLGGATDKESLTVRGWQRAGALASFFGSSDDRPLPEMIYASGAEKHRRGDDSKVGSKSERPGQTVSVLAAKLKLSVVDTFSKGQEPELVAEVSTRNDTTLICWQHEDIPKIASLILGTSKGFPSSWPDDRFDVMWRFARQGAGQAWTFTQVCQNLLSGDDTKPIDWPLAIA